MCGIAGIVNYKKDISSDKPIISEMTGTLEKRGPDDSGYHVSKHALLGHRRLVVVDPKGGAQPMQRTVAGRTYTIVYNGELYNYRELRKQLPGPFLTTGDTEVVLAACMHWGPEAVRRFNAMWAMAFVDVERRAGHLSRDPIGIKPLYWARTANSFRFASSLPALVRAGGVDTSIDTEALHSYMTFHAVVPAPYTMLQGVRKLPPATLMWIEPDGIYVMASVNSHRQTVAALLTVQAADELPQLGVSAASLNEKRLPRWLLDSLEKVVNDALTDMQLSWSIDQIELLTGQAIITGEID